MVRRLGRLMTLQVKRRTGRRLPPGWCERPGWRKVLWSGCFSGGCHAAGRATAFQRTLRCNDNSGMVAGEGIDENKVGGARAWCGAGSVNRMGPDGRYSLDDYQLRTSSDLLDICTLDPSHSHYWEGRSFLHRLLRQRDRPADALAVSKDFPRLACPRGKVTRTRWSRRSSPMGRRTWNIWTSDRWTPCSER
jgi:hypothetical protein